MQRLLLLLSSSRQVVSVSLHSLSSATKLLNLTVFDGVPICICIKSPDTRNNWAHLVRVSLSYLVRRLCVCPTLSLSRLRFFFSLF